MPVSVVCDAASVVNAALRESIGNSSTQHHQNNNNSNIIQNTQNNYNKKIDNDNDDDDNDINGEKQNLQNKLIASTKRGLLTKIEYEEVSNYNQSVLDTLKSKYIILKPANCNGKLNQSSTSTTSTTSTSTSTTTGDGDKETNHHHHHNTSNAISGQHNNVSKDSNQLPQPKRVLYPKENVQIGWRNSNFKWQIGAGMINVGNTCYLNSTLQALFHVPAMANWLISDSEHRKKCDDENGIQQNGNNSSNGGCIICAMSKTLISSQTSQSPIRPYLVYSKLKLVCKHLVMGRQEDAHEFLRYLVEAMEKSYLSRFRNWKELDQHSKETTPLNQILGGYLRSTVRCLACGHISTTFQHFQDLLLDIRKANSVEEALDGYFSRERLEDMGYKCEACKKKVSATKQFSLERAPVSLCIQLKRFSMMGTKLNKHVTIRPRLDLSLYASKKLSSSCKTSEQLNYRLVAMVTHLGASQHCGHYTAIGVTDAGGYYQFDDAFVRPISLQNVLNTNAYIIFYELEDSHHQQQYSLSTITNSSKLSSTQVSGEHNQHHNNTLEQIKENPHHKMNGQIVHSSNENTNFQKHNNNNNNSSDSKLVNKSETKVTTSSTIIGPQLPDKLFLNGYKSPVETSKSNINSLYNSTSNTTPHKLVSSPTTSKLVKPVSSSTPSSNNLSSSETTSSSISNATTLPQTPTKQKLVANSSNQQSLNNKLVIHFKNTNINTTSASNSNNNSSSTLNETNTKLQIKSPTPKSQLIDSIKTQNDSKKSTLTLLTTNVTLKNTLPNMPNLESPSQKLSSLSLVRYSPNKNIASTSTTNTTTNSSIIGSIANKLAMNSSITIRAPNKISPIKSLVPYESDDESISDNSDSGYHNNSKTSTNYINTTNKNSNNNNNNNNNNNKSSFTIVDENSSSSSSSSHSVHSSPEVKNPKTPPSPAVVKSKVGLWQVTSVKVSHTNTTITNSNSNSSSPTMSPSKTTTATTTVTERRNPFATDSTISTSGSSTSNFYSSSSSSFSKLNGGIKEKNKFNGNNSKKYEGGYVENNNSGNAVNKLMKFSHRGYGAPVLSWNGQRTEMEKEVSEESRLERKRELRDDEENEMDRGRQKKIKTHNNNNSRDNSSGFNPFQEYQNSQQQHQRRWNNSSNSNSSNNNNNNTSNNNNNNNRYHGQNGHNNNILYNRQNNPFYRNNNNNNNNSNSNNSNFRNRNNNHHNHYHRFNNHHQRSHHQRNNGGDNNRFHHRRDS